MTGRIYIGGAGWPDGFFPGGEGCAGVLPAVCRIIPVRDGKSGDEAWRAKKSYLIFLRWFGKYSIFANI